MSDSQVNAAAKPWIEVKRKLGPATYAVYAAVYRQPLRVWVRGCWLWGRPRG